MVRPLATVAPAVRRGLVQRQQQLLVARGVASLSGARTLATAASTPSRTARAGLTAMPLSPLSISPRLVLSHRHMSHASQSSSATALSAVAPSSKYSADALIIGVPTSDNKLCLNEAPEARREALTTQLGKLGFKGKAGNTQVIPGGEGDAAAVLMFVGLGADPKPEALRRAAGAAVRTASGMELKSVAVALPAADAEALTAVAEGASLGAYTWDSYKSKDKTAPVSTIQVVSSLKDAAEVVRRAEITARHVKAARDLVNTPPNDLYPQTFAERAQEGAKGLDGVTVEVWDEKRLKEENCGGLVGVGQGSTRPPRLVKVAYTPSNGGKHLAIVGKGVTFDSGGISLKPSPGMHEMKGDMGGAAATLHAVLAAAELQVPTRVTGWLCLAENMPSGSALKNGDVIRQRTGTTVEIHNTDAEGRLVLADGLACAQSKATGYGTEETDPDLLLNVATLTGAQLVALGTRTAGLMGDDKAIEAVKAASDASGELFWPMPFPEELLEDLKSTTADLKNIGSNRWAGMLKAGVFLKQFAGEKGNWAHLDIAGPAANFGAAHGYTSTEGTGFGVRTLVKVAEQLA